MIDIIKLRMAYSALNRISQGKDPFNEGELSLEAIQSEEMHKVFADTLEVIAAYGKLMNVITQSTDFKVVPLSNSKKLPFSIKQEVAEAIPATDGLINISSFVKYINEQLESEGVRKLTTTGLGNWLVAEGYLTLPEGSKNKISTEKGNALGISTEDRTGYTGEIYQINYYSPAAQRFILDNLPQIGEFLQQMKGAKEDV